MDPIPNPPEPPARPRAGRRAPAPVPIQPAPPVQTAPAPATPDRELRPASPPATAAPEAPASPLADRLTRLAAMETALAEAIRRQGRLSVPDLAPNQPATVTLTVPADFARILDQQARLNGLADATASFSLTATLAGDGFTVTPEAVQSRPVVAGQPTVFEWTVAPAAGPRGALRAEVGGRTAGGDDTLKLGTVQAGGDRVWPGGEGGRMAGYVALALIAAFVTWLAASRRDRIRARRRPR